MQPRRVTEIRIEPLTQVLGLADVDHGAGGVAEAVHPGVGRDGSRGGSDGHHVAQLRRASDSRSIGGAEPPLEGVEGLDDAGHDASGHGKLVVRRAGQRLGVGEAEGSEEGARHLASRVVEPQQDAASIGRIVVAPDVPGRDQAFDHIGDRGRGQLERGREAARGQRLAGTLGAEDGAQCAEAVGCRFRTRRSVPDPLDASPIAERCRQSSE